MEGFNGNAPLDDISRQVLLLLSHEENFTVHNISKAIQQPDNAALYAVTILEKRNFIFKKGTNNSYQISKEGSDYLAVNFGIRVTRPTPPTNPKELIAKQKNRLLTYITKFVVWAAIPIWLMIPSLILSIGFVGTATITNNFAKLGLSLILALLIVLYFVWTLRIVKQSTTVVIFRLGICIGARGPGIIVILPIFDKVHFVELKVDHKEIYDEACITKDNVQIKVDFVYFWKILDAERSVTQVSNALESIEKLATGALRAVIAGFDFSEVQEKRQDLNVKLRDQIEATSSDWGIDVINVEIQEVKTSPEIKTAMEEWRAARWKSEAIATLAEGQAKALNSLHAAAYNLDSNTLNLKYFEMLEKLGQSQATKYIFPMELTNLIRSWIQTNEQKENEQETRNDSPKLE